MEICTDDGARRMWDVPTHVTMLTYFMMVLDRYSFLQKPSRTRLPGLIFSLATWLTAICIVLPYPIYTTYVDIGAYINAEEVGLCAFGIEKDLKEYSKTIFFSLYVVPLLAIGYLFVQMSEILERTEETIVFHGYEIRLQGSLRRYYMSRRCLRNSHRRDILIDVDDTDPKQEEKLFQKYLACLIAIFGTCSLALSVLKLVHMNSEETYETSHHWDVLFVVTVWIAYLPTVLGPLLILRVIMDGEDISHIRQSLKIRNKGSIRHRNLDDDASVTYTSRPSNATISTDFGLHNDQRKSSSCENFV